MNTPKCLQLSNFGGELKKLGNIYEERRADKNLSAISVVKNTEGSMVHIISQIPKRRVVVTPDNLAAKSLVKKLKSWGLQVEYMPYRDDVLLPRVGFATSYVRTRMNTLTSIINDKVDVIVTSADTLLQLFPKRELVEKYIVNVSTSQIITPQELQDKLALSGYVRQDMIQEEGDFSIRGDIVDVYSIDGNAYRINFFDEIIEDIKQIRPNDFVSVQSIDYVSFPPTSDIILDEKGLELTKKRLGQHLENKYAVDAYEKLHVGVEDPSLVWALPFMREMTTTFLSFIKEDNIPTELILDEPKAIDEKLEILLKEFNGRIKTLSSSGEILEEHKYSYITRDDVTLDIIPMMKISFSSSLTQNKMFTTLKVIEVSCAPITRYYLDVKSLYSDLRRYTSTGVKVIIASGSKELAKSMTKMLCDEGIAANYSENGNDEDLILCTPLKIESGVYYSKQRVCLIGMSECVGKNNQEVAKMRNTTFIAPKIGDYVVHKVHGIGICEGTTIIKSGEFEKEYIVIKYRDGDTLYVATDQTDNLQKYIGDDHPRINKLGGKDFEKEKEKVRKSVKQLAFDLVQLYAQREAEKGYTYSEDTIWQKEFEDSFEYTETQDQLKAIADIKSDMEKGRLMDRLVVGDVGFGKTEVAFRAIFKTILDSKQAVLLAPTTILARQHYENLLPRIEPYGIKCAILTRLQSTKERESILKGLKDGIIHIVIATHMVLSKNVEFNDLGLLVLDEEQRFGVGHKETLKQKYPLINVLTLSATPIPRTLNMSLTGLRDISMLETPPEGRLPVETYVVEYSDALCVDAINREIDRGGQVLILCNNIEELDPFADKLRHLCEKQTNIITAHGQMQPADLEKRIGAFYEKKYNVLIATTIIENGIDLPDANTLIVMNSNRFGLSQLYQLRGRVGRRGVLAHAYFTLSHGTTLTEDADKRLNTLLDNTAIGSGFKISLADLSIRGAGNLLGPEQSGHISKIGYEMYMEILNESIQEIKTGKPAKKKSNVEMKIEAPAFIREGYVSAKDKIRIYKQIAQVSSPTERDELIKQLEDIYGKVEIPLRNLIDIALLKNIAGDFNVSKIIINSSGAGVTFKDESILKDEVLMKAISNNASDVVLTSTIPISLIFNVKNYNPTQKIEKVLSFFESTIKEN